MRVLTSLLAVGRVVLSAHLNRFSDLRLGENGTISGPVSNQPARSSPSQRTRTDALSPRMLRVIEELAGDWRGLDLSRDNRHDESRAFLSERPHGRLRKLYTIEMDPHEDQGQAGSDIF